MSEQQVNFLEELRKEYVQMKNFLLTIIGVILAGVIALGGTQIADAAATRKQVEINTQKIEYIMQTSVSQSAIDKLIVSFENQSEVIEKYLPEDIKGAIQEFSEKSSELRQNIIMFNTSLTNRGLVQTE